MASEADNGEKPEDTRYVEELNSDKIERFNEQLVNAGNEPLPEDATKLEFRTDGSVIVHLSDGTTQTRHGPDGTAEGSGVHPMGVKHEIKKVVAGCLGVSVAALSSWGALVEQFATWQKATKFLVRRFGVIGAVSCAGGIIWKYI
ncbi:hypothetical protein [Actinopolyspora mortivallis]|uniref:hypothetical protein n=1 Tax=Actinopolyspora mortivallis TaxID=33906 RepID=UPI00146B0614|nr:hypothetical protein [Actinopolyspora mortivallis]